MSSPNANYYELSTVTEIESGDGCTGVVYIDAAHDIFKGHFPGQPVLPGVCQLELLEKMSSEYINRKLILVSASNIKYLQMIDPSVSPQLHMALKILSQDDDQVKIKGSIKVGEKICFKCTGFYKLVD